MGLANELLKAYEPEIESITLIPSDGSRFEVKINDKLIYSKLQTNRHAEPGEVVGLVGKFKGYFAWLLWSIVHLLSIIGVKNKLFVLLDWTWKYLTYDQALRLLIKHKGRY